MHSARVDRHSTLVGTGLALWGIGLYGAAIAGTRSERYLRHVAESRWRFERILMRKDRSGKPPDEWIAQVSTEQRRVVKWFITPFLLIWLGLCLVAVVNGLPR